MRTFNIFGFAGRSLALGEERTAGDGLEPRSRPSATADCINGESAKTPSGRPGQPRTAVDLMSRAADLTGFGVRILGAVLLRQRLRRIALFFRVFSGKAVRAFEYADSGLVLVALLLFLASAGMGVFGALVMAVAP